MAWKKVKRRITLWNERPILLKTVQDIWQGKTEALLFQIEGSCKDLTTTGGTCSWIGLGPETKGHNRSSWWNLNGVWTLDGSTELMCISVLHSGYVGKNPSGAGRVHAGELRGSVAAVCSQWFRHNGGTHMCTHTQNKDLLYNIGSYSQYFVITYKEKEHICIYTKTKSLKLTNTVN